MYVMGCGGHLLCVCEVEPCLHFCLCAVSSFRGLHMAIIDVVRCTPDVWDNDVYFQVHYVRSIKAPEVAVMVHVMTMPALKGAPAVSVMVPS